MPDPRRVWMADEIVKLRATTRLPSGTLVPTLSAKNCACSGSLKP